MKYKKSVYRSLVFITQFGINMLVPIFLCTMAGVYIGRKFSMEWITIPLFAIGALAGFRNIFIMAKRIYSDTEETSTRYTAVHKELHREKETPSGHSAMGKKPDRNKESDTEHVKKN